MIRFLILSMVFGLTVAEFHPHFYNFLVKNYGKSVADQLSRRDIGRKGSFGGGNPNSKVFPIVLVHGLGGSAGQRKKDLYKKYKSYGQPAGTVYATTFANGELLYGVQHAMLCEYIKLVRSLIVAVHDYTGQRLNVVGVSMGSPISRKAILGGRCVDTNEDLGPPLTNLVRRYVSVAGANRGALMCGNPLPFPNGICSPINGLNCNSLFIKDINNQTGYEGDRIFNIYSLTDEIVGYMNNCGERASYIAGAVDIEQNHKTHRGLITTSTEEQWKALNSQ